LTAREYNILKLLMTNMDRVFSSAQIYEAVWNEPAFHVSKIVSVHIRHIREKIEIDPKEPRYLKVIYGLGYKVVKAV
jgi:DNA-binding response OmpR family regulator